MFEKLIVGQNIFLNVFTASLRLKLKDFLGFRSYNKKNIDKYLTTCK